MLAVESARQAYIQRLHGGEHEAAVLVTYETPWEELTLRVLSYGARIHWNSLESMNGDVKTLSTAKQLKPYELDMFQDSLMEVAQSLESRAGQATLMVANKHLIVVDMTGASTNAGNGFIEEIANRIDKEMSDRGITKVRQIVVDYVGAMAKKHLAATNGKDDHLRHLIGGAGP